MSNKNNKAVEDLFSDLPEGSLKVLQITDTHLYSDTEGTLLGLNTQSALDEVLEMTREYGKVDLILSTGDLVHDSSEIGYKRFKSIFESLGIPVYCLPGNHDNPDMMKKCLVNSNVQYISSVVHNDWVFTFLDTKLPNSEVGHLADKELKLLESTLAAHPNKQAFVCLHHNPVPIDSAWMDTMQVDNSEAFFNIIDKHDNVKGILWGHIHQIYEKERKGVKLMATPSTCIQFTPEKDDFGLDDVPPGCRWLALLPNGEIRTHVTRLSSIPAGLDVNNSAGY